jgi:hypothetical protein
MKQTSSPAAPPKAADRDRTAEAVSEEVAAVLEQVRTLLEAGDTNGAREALARARSNSPWLTNALGVCLLRVGEAGRALDLFRGLVLPPTGISFRPDAPTPFKVNFVTALLASGNVAGGISSLTDLGTDGHPGVARLRKAVERWKREMSWWEWLRWHMGGEPARSVVLDFPPGEL